MLGTSVHSYKKLNLGQKICDAFAKDKECDYQGLIPALGFGAAVGAYGLIDAIAGIVSLFMDIIPYIIMLGLDGLAAIVYLAGGAVSISCPPPSPRLRRANWMNRPLPALLLSWLRAAEAFAPKSRPNLPSTSLASLSHLRFSAWDFSGNDRAAACTAQSKLVTRTSAVAQDSVCTTEYFFKSLGCGRYQSR